MENNYSWVLPAQTASFYADAGRQPMVRNVDFGFMSGSHFDLNLSLLREQYSSTAAAVKREGIGMWFLFFYFFWTQGKLLVQPSCHWYHLLLRPLDIFFFSSSRCSPLSSVR